MATVKCEISDRDIQQMDGYIPLPVQIRLKLNEAGFKFEDDGKFSALLNTSPRPLGVITRRYDVENRVTHFEQRL